MSEHRRLAVVTGAGSGIGRRTAQDLLAAGWSVGAWDRERTALDWVAEYDEALAVVVDVTDERSVADAGRVTLEHFGRCDLLVNCAGVFLAGGVGDHSMEEVRRLFDVNVMGTVIVARQLVDRLREDHGAIVNLASVVASKPSPTSSYYAASKAAIAQLTRSWALELAADGVRVNAVAPGVVRTPLFEAAGQDEATIGDFWALRERENPMGRLGEPADVSRWILRLGLSDEWVTGAVVPIDGGMGLT